MKTDTLSTIYKLLANNTDNNVDSSSNNSHNTLTYNLYDLLPNIAIIDADNYETHFEQLKNLTYHISQIMTDEATSKVSIGVGGGFSAGKSRFINTLLDMDVLPEALEPCTAVATYLTHNDNDNTQALNIFNTAVDVEQAQLKQLRHFIGDDSENSLHISQVIKHVTINTPQIKWQNITFLDTPGYSKADADESIVNDENLALSQLSAVDHIVWLVSAKNGTIRDEDIQFLQRVNPQTPIFVVLTQADLVNQMDTDIPLIMQGVKDHLENNDIALAGIMAWAAPAYTDKGEYIAGDDIHDWLDDLNDQQMETHLNHLIEYCEMLNLTAQHKLDYLDKDNSYDKELYKLISKGQEQIKDYKEAIIELVSEYRAFDWDLAEIYASGKIDGGIDKAIDIYKTKVPHNKDRAIDKLNSLVFRTHNINSIQALADIYDKQLNHPEAAAKYHCLILKKDFKSKQAKVSWQWLLNKSTTNDTIFKELYSLVDQIDNPEYTYKFAVLADQLGKYEISIEMMLVLAEGYNSDSLAYLESKAKSDSTLKLRLGRIYKDSNLVDYQYKAINLFKETVKDHTQETLIYLKDMTYSVYSIGSLALITLARIYEKQLNQVEEATRYYLLVTKKFPNSYDANISWKWLVNNSKRNTKVFAKLYELVIKFDEPELNYKFGILLYSSNKYEHVNAHKYAVDFIIKAARKKYKPAIDWLFVRATKNPKIKLELALIYEKHNTQEDKLKSLQLYKELANQGNQIAIDRLEVLAKNHDNNSNEAIRILTDIFDTSNLSKASIYHQLVINRQPETQDAQKSWDWLFTNAIANKNVFNTLKNLVDVHNSFDRNYKMLLLADTVQRHDLATEYALLNASNGHIESKDWLLSKANISNHPAKDKLYSLYTAGNKIDNINEIIYENLMQKIIKGDEIAFHQLNNLARYHQDHKAMWLLSLCYMYGKSVKQSDKKAERWLEQSANHVSEARYNLDVIHYQNIKHNYPFSWILRLFTDVSDPLFKDLKAQRYLIYLGLITPDFMDLDFEASYNLNIKIIILYVACLFILLFLLFL